jgi:hypothetical protein
LDSSSPPSGSSALVMAAQPVLASDRIRNRSAKPLSVSRTVPWPICALAGVSSAPTDPLVGNGNSLPWQLTTKGSQQIGSPAGAYAGAISTAVTMAGCPAQESAQ